MISPAITLPLTGAELVLVFLFFATGLVDLDLEDVVFFWVWAPADFLLDEAEPLLVFFAVDFLLVVAILYLLSFQKLGCRLSEYQGENNRHCTYDPAVIRKITELAFIGQ